MMLFPIRKLLEGRDKPLCVNKDTIIKDALALMVSNDYSQLPIVDESGELWGMISEATLIRYYYHTEAASPLLALTVDHCQTRPPTISPDEDIFNALDLLQNDFAIVVVEENKPVGILTDYDTTHFFRDLSGGLILVEDIEVTLRQYIETAFPTEHAKEAALMRAFRHRKQDPSKPAREYEELNFWEHIQLIVTEGNWEKFEKALAPKGMFLQLMGPVKDVRNQLMHFRGRLDPIQHDALLRARDWLAVRPRLGAPPPEEKLVDLRVSEGVSVSAQVSASLQTTSKYEPFADFLGQLKANEVTLSFARIESELGVELPPSARQHRSWWANDHTSHVQSLAWLSAGWRVDDVNLSSERVVFRRTISVLQQLYFADLLERLKEARPGLTRATKTQAQNWWSFGGGKAGFSFAWVFNKDNELQVELYIDTGSREENKAVYDALWKRKQEVEAEIGHALKWERLDPKRASRISLARPGTATDLPEAQEQTKQWALGTMLSFVDAFQPRIGEL